MPKEAAMLWKTVIRWAVAAVVVPVAAAGARKGSRAVEARRGPSGATRLLSRSADALQRFGGRKPRGRLRGR
jgi:hypothetical protein